MAKRKSITTAGASRKRKVKTVEIGDWGPWSDLNHDVLYVVMMLLGLIDYLSFGIVCKSWRTLAVSNRNAFMAATPPMAMLVSWRGSKKPCYLEDFEGRKFKTILPHFAGEVCVGLTCGYLIFFRRTTRVFWLVNPITRHELSFTDFPGRDQLPFNDPNEMKNAKAILVFSLSICGWVFLVIPNHSTKMWYSIAGRGTWNPISCTSLFADICAFKGMIYTLNENPNNHLRDQVFELRLNSEPKLRLLETKNSLNPSKSSQLVSSNSGDNIYVMDRDPPNVNIYMRGPLPKIRYRFQELDLGEMKWVSHEKTLGECACFFSKSKYGFDEKPLLGESHGRGLLLAHNKEGMLKLIELEKQGSSKTNMWYFPHECLNVDLVND